MLCCMPNTENVNSFIARVELGLNVILDLLGLISVMLPLHTDVEPHGKLESVPVNTT